MRIVLVEDNESLAQGIANALRDQGYAVDWLADGDEAYRFLASEGGDIAIIDINLPGRNGIEIVRALRKQGSGIPIIMLTARSDLSDRVTGLDAGADDYLVKPFDMAELTARIRALSRRRADIQTGIREIGQIQFNQTARTVIGPAGPIDLPRRELALLECLMDHSGRIVSKERIADTLYGIGSEVEANAVELLISRLRRKLANTGVSIRTARGLGYLLDDTPA
ncbi:response regulator transcription factor (plasmid) [Pseudorhodobacter turbinis]|uniref:Response regulator transcription factor n=1 Tax=Pseudorhodobacter turbinis TaxID=2500533 RepID=A0A4P8ELT9_9RHOB|nr:response regulator transcription factor [Pseudorhodobacter turbinis]QCO58078.1 response regulator transcription factor [Pseudorhodobacter turbinis]